MYQNQGKVLIRREEHLVITAEPGSQYLDHKELPNSSGQTIADAIINVIDATNSRETIELLLCDGAASNTGEHGGAIRIIEDNLQRNLFHSVCLLHTNELPLRHLFAHLDGTTTGPRSFSGPIGVQITSKTLQNRPIVNFARIDPGIAGDSLDFVNPDLLSADQKFFANAWRSLVCGVWIGDPTLSPGAPSQSRWIHRSST